MSGLPGALPAAAAAPRPALRVRLALPALLLVALATAGAGTATLPLDDHDTFVVQTAQEMRERHDWLVPHFHGRPRLNKPPLSYWLAALAADASGADRVAPWHGRAASVAGAVGVVWLTAWIGTQLLDRRRGLVGGLVAATSLGLFKFAHSARPDMLYAFWCTAIVALWVALRHGPARRWPARALWGCVALATLTKGPHLPALLIAAAALEAWWAGWSLRRLRGALRPVEGVAIALACTLPWWWAVDRALGPGGLRGTQLGGSLLVPGLGGLLRPYYAWAPLQLLVPSVVVAPLALVRRRWPSGDREATRLLVLLVAVPALALSFGPQRRLHYLLPALAPMALLLAMAIGALGEAADARGRRRLAVALALLWAGTALVAVRFAASERLWSRRRFVEARLGALAGTRIAAGVPLLALDTSAAAEGYYAGRTVRAVRSPARLVAAVRGAPGGAAGALVEGPLLDRLPPGVGATVLAEDRDERGRRLVLALLRTRP